MNSRTDALRDSWQDEQDDEHDSTAVATPDPAAADFGNCVNCNRRIYRTGRMWYHQSSGGITCGLSGQQEPTA